MLNPPSDAIIEFHYKERSDAPLSHKFNNPEYGIFDDVFFDYECWIDSGEPERSDAPGYPRSLDYCEIKNILIILIDRVEVEYPDESHIVDPLHQQLIKDLANAYYSEIENEVLGN